MINLKKFGPREVVSVERDGKQVMDTIYHTIPDFNFLNQFGEHISNADVSEKIYVADFIFTTCQGICPKMSSNLQRVQNEFKDQPDLLLLTHTVDPERDTVEALAAYAQKMEAIPGRWHFLTGKKKELYDLARHGYFVTAMDGNGGAEDFIHSEKLILIDKAGRIRGFYDGTDTKEVDRLIDEIRVLKAEEFVPRKN